MSSASEFVYILRPTRRDMLRSGPTAQEAAAIASHFAYLQGHCRLGSVVLAGRTTTDDEHTFGVCVFRAESAAAAEKFMHADPAVAAGVMSAELSPFRIALLASDTHPSQPIVD